MGKEVVKWHGRDLEYIVTKLNNKFGAGVGISIEGEYFAGSTLESYYDDTPYASYYRFDNADEAINAAIKKMESHIERIATGSTVEKVRKQANAMIQEAEDKRKVAVWLMKLIK